MIAVPMSDPFADEPNEPAPGIAVPAFLKDPSRPVPPAVWLALTVLVSLSLLLALRLLAVRSGPPSPSAPIVAGPAATRNRPAIEVKELAAPRDFDFQAFVETWRDAWQRRDLDAYIGHYAKSFGSQDRDLAAWSAYKRSVFESPDELEVEVEDLEVRALSTIVIVSFVQTYRAGVYQDRGVKKLYLVSESGAWRIFNEEWKALP